MKKFLFLLLIPVYVLAFGPGTSKQIDEITNHSGISDITLKPNANVKIDTFTGDFALQSGPAKEVQESAVTSTELGHLTGVTSNIQTQLDAKVPQTRNLITTSPLFIDGVGSADLSADRTITIQQATTLLDGFLSAVDWNTFNNKEDALPWDTFGDLVYFQPGGPVKLPIGTNGQILSVGVSSNPLWVDPPATSPLTTKGDIYTYDTDNQRLAVGTDDQILTADSTQPTGLAWKDAPATSPLTTKGDLYTFDSDNQRLPIGTDGQILQANSAEATGMNWVDPPSTSPTTTEGDIIVRGASEDERLGIGTNGQLLTSNGTTASWQDAPVSTTLTTKGDIQTFDTANQRLAVGNDGEFLVADSNETTGLKWSDQLQGVLNPVTDFDDFTLVATNGITLGNASITSQYKIIGDELKIYAKIVLGSTSSISGDIRFNLPVGYSIKTSTTGSLSTSANFGTAKFLDAGNEILNASVVGTNVSNQQFIIRHKKSNGQPGGTGIRDNVIGSTEPFSWTTNDEIIINATFPINESSSGTNAVVRNEVMQQSKAGQTTDQVIPFSSNTDLDLQIVSYDNFSSVDLVNNWIELKKDGKYTIIPNVRLRNQSSSATNTNTRCVVDLFVDSGSGFVFRENLGQWRVTTSVTALWAFECGFKSFTGMFNAGDKVKFVVNHNFAGTVETIANSNQIAVNREPDSNVITGTFGKCMRKELTADIGSDTVNIADLRFNNVDPGDRLMVRMRPYYRFVNNDNIQFDAQTNGNTICRDTRGMTGGGYNLFTSIECVFTAQASTVTFNATSIAAGNFIFGNGSIGETYVELCTDNTEDTLEWN